MFAGIFATNAAAQDLLLTGRSIDGREAHRLGLVQVVADDPEAAALAWFDQHLAGRSASSLRFAVSAVREGRLERVRSQLAAAEALYLGPLMSSRDAVHRHWTLHVTPEAKANYLCGPAQLSQLAEKAAHEGDSVLDHLRMVRTVLTAQLAAMSEARLW